MKKRIISSLAGIVLAAATSIAAAATTAAQEPAGAARLSIPEIHEKMQAAGYRDIRKIELEKDIYKIKAQLPGGDRVKLRVDASSGEILERTQKKSR